jgi:hypothetical protein
MEQTMADKPNPPPANDRPLNHGHLANWTDGFPHSFHGWGPQTPDPAELGYTQGTDHGVEQHDSLDTHRTYADEALREHDRKNAVRLRFPDQALTWRAQGEKRRDHIVWRFD